MTQLTFDPSCYKVVLYKGTSRQFQFDGSVRIDNTFDIINRMGSSANRVLIAMVWGGNVRNGIKQRVLDLLVDLCLPQGHPHFRNIVTQLISEYHGIMNPVQVLMCVTSSISGLQKSIKKHE